MQLIDDVIGKQQRAGVLRQIAHLPADVGHVPAGHVPAIDPDLAPARCGQAHQRFEQRSFAGPVAAHQRHNFAGPHLHVDALHHGLAIKCHLNLFGLQIRLAALRRRAGWPGNHCPAVEPALAVAAALFDGQRQRLPAQPLGQLHQRRLQLNVRQDFGGRAMPHARAIGGQVKQLVNKGQHPLQPVLGQHNC
ncbi:MAG: hypothetical protein FOGNACKC_05112 [Anaerolineae bacterium]|nr:hypothetical protein [Anaerolineae bacterium]